MSYVADEAISALRGNFNLGVFIRIGFQTPMLLAFGINDVPIKIPSLDPDGTVYLGAGRFTDIPTLETLINGLADKVTFQLSGVDPDLVAIVMSTNPAVLGSLVTVGIAPMDERYQPITQIIGLWTGTADYVAMEMKEEKDGSKNRVQSLMLACTTGDSSRSFPNLTTYSDLTQKTLYPTDRFFERVSRYQPGVLISWPRF